MNDILTYTAVYCDVLIICYLTLNKMSNINRVYVKFAFNINIQDLGEILFISECYIKSKPCTL